MILLVGQRGRPIVQQDGGAHQISTLFRYKVELRQLATNMKDISAATVSSMRSAPILLGSRRVDTDHTTKVKETDNNENEASTPGYEEDTIEVVYELLRADQVSRIVHHRHYDH